MLFGGFSIFVSDADYADFFYGVREKDSTADRIPYNGKWGLVNTRFLVGVFQEIGTSWSVFAGGSYSTLELAANKDSPLVETKHNFGYLLGFIWTFKESNERVN